MPIVEPPIYGFYDGRLEPPSNEDFQEFCTLRMRAERFCDLAGQVLEQAEEGRTTGITFNFSASVLSGLRFAFMYHDSFNKLGLPYEMSPDGGRDAWEQRTLPSGHGLPLDELAVTVRGDKDYDIKGHGELDGGLVMVDFESLTDMYSKVALTLRHFDPLDSN
ncbi:MAG: hypothetical protein QG553_232 [Patescibacteria group bacterium]|nr:hypothetical protein [Patescibacteria group bacterium]